jgi:hypothetical protein
MQLDKKRRRTDVARERTSRLGVFDSARSHLCRYRHSLLTLREGVTANAPNRDVIHGQTELRHHLFQVAVAERVPQIPSHTKSDDHVLGVRPSKKRRPLLAR